LEEKEQINGAGASPGYCSDVINSSFLDQMSLLESPKAKSCRKKLKRESRVSLDSKSLSKAAKRASSVAPIIEECQSDLEKEASGEEK